MHNYSINVYERFYGPILSNTQKHIYKCTPYTIQFKTQRIHGHTSIYHFVITDNLAIVGI
jgi:hypothetical protein